MCRHSFRGGCPSCATALGLLHPHCGLEGKSGPWMEGFLSEAGLGRAFPAAARAPRGRRGAERLAPAPSSASSPPRGALTRSGAMALPWRWLQMLRGGSQEQRSGGATLRFWKGGSLDAAAGLGAGASGPAGGLAQGVDTAAPRRRVAPQRSPPAPARAPRLP